MRPALHDLNISASQLNTVLLYRPETGALIWRPFFMIARAKWHTVATKDYASGAGLSVNIANLCIPAHRIIWCMTHDAWPKGKVTHRNGNPYDNRIENLATRETTNNPPW